MPLPFDFQKMFHSPKLTETFCECWSPQPRTRELLTTQRHSLSLQRHIPPCLPLFQSTAHHRMYRNGARVIHRFVWSPTGKTNSHVVPVRKKGGRDSRSTGGALRSDTGGGGGGEGANPSGGTHPGGTCERAEHGGGTVSASL